MISDDRFDVLVNRAANHAAVVGAMLGGDRRQVFHDVLRHLVENEHTGANCNHAAEAASEEAK